VLLTVLTDVDDGTLYTEKSRAGGRYSPAFEPVDCRCDVFVSQYIGDDGDDGVELV